MTDRRGSEGPLVSVGWLCHDAEDPRKGVRLGLAVDAGAMGFLRCVIE